MYTRIEEKVLRSDTGEVVTAGMYFIDDPKEELLELECFDTYNEDKQKQYNGRWNELSVEERKKFLISKMKK